MPLADTTTPQTTQRFYNDDLKVIRDIQKKLVPKHPYLRGMGLSNFVRWLVEEYYPKET